MANQEDSSSMTVETTYTKHSLTSGPKSVLSREQLASSGATTLAQALQQFGTVQLQDTLGNSSRVSLSMRGFGGNAVSNTLLLVNGIPLTNPDLAPPASHRSARLCAQADYPWPILSRANLTKRCDETTEQRSNSQDLSALFVPGPRI